MNNQDGVEWSAMWTALQILLWPGDRPVKRCKEQNCSIVTTLNASAVLPALLLLLSSSNMYQVMVTAAAACRKNWRRSVTVNGTGRDSAGRRRPGGRPVPAPLSSPSYNDYRFLTGNYIDHCPLAGRQTFTYLTLFRSRPVNSVTKHWNRVSGEGKKRGERWEGALA